MEEEQAAVAEEAPPAEAQSEAPPPAEALPEVQPEVHPAEEPAPPPEPAPEEPAPPAEEKSPLDLVFDKIEARLAVLEAVAHQDHNFNFSLDESAINQIADLVEARVNMIARKHI